MLFVQPKYTLMTTWYHCILTVDISFVMKSPVVGVCDNIHCNSEHQPYEGFAC